MNAATKTAALCGNRRNYMEDSIVIVIIRIKPKEEEPEVPKMPLVRPGSIVVLPSGRMFYVKYIGVDKNNTGPFYSGEDVEHPQDGKQELVHSFLEKFGYKEIISPGTMVAEIRRAYSGEES
jgi:hypothetical protein